MFLEKIYELAPDESRVLFSEIIENQTVEVREWQQYRWLRIGGESVQTLMDKNAIDKIALPNIQALLTVLLFLPTPKRLLNLGLGGASIERYLDSKHPEIKIRSLESSEQIIQLAKDYFYLPKRVDVIHAYAEEFLSTHKDTYDIILCDIFANELHPDCLYRDEFYSSIFNCLNKEGVLAINLLPDSEEDVIKVLLPMKKYFDHISLLEVPNHMNAIIFASQNRLPDYEELDKVANDLFEQTELDLRDIPENINRLMEMVRGEHV